MQDGFVDLCEAVPGVAAEIRYATAHNLTGHPLAGYEAPRALATTAAAQALARAFQAAQAAGFGLLIYDAYRPQRAVADFVTWSRQPEDFRTKTEFYPHLDKAQLFPLGYIALKSGHSRGSTIDLTLTRDGQPVEMGTAFDYMGEESHHGWKDCPGSAAEHRAALCRIMTDAGFEPYENEWWHYRLKDEPYPDTYFDFVID